MTRFLTTLALLSTLALGTGCGAAMQSTPPGAAVSIGSSVDRFDRSEAVTSRPRSGARADSQLDQSSTRTSNCDPRFCD